MRLHKLNHEGFREIRKLIANTHASYQVFMLWKTQGGMNNPLPKQKQRHGFLLVFCHNIRPTHFN